MCLAVPGKILRRWEAALPMADVAYGPVVSLPRLRPRSARRRLRRRPRRLHPPLARGRGRAAPRGAGRPLTPESAQPASWLHGRRISGGVLLEATAEGHVALGADALGENRDLVGGWDDTLFGGVVERAAGEEPHRHLPELAHIALRPGSSSSSGQGSPRAGLSTGRALHGQGSPPSCSWQSPRAGLPSSRACHDPRRARTPPVAA